VEALEADVVFANEAEWEELAPSGGFALTSVVKRGARGIRIFGWDEVELPAHDAEVVDATGAGDALAAGYLVGGPELALEAAARCVAKIGAMP
jgi:sugar/nucleoside kinase (ribokinase family)